MSSTERPDTGPDRAGAPPMPLAVASAVIVEGLLVLLELAAGAYWPVVVGGMLVFGLRWRSVAAYHLVRVGAVLTVAWLLFQGVDTMTRGADLTGLAPLALWTAGRVWQLRLLNQPEAKAWFGLDPDRPAPTP